MKRLIAFFFLTFLWSNSSLSEILKFDCNYYSSWKEPNLKTNLRIIDTEKKIFKIILEGIDNKKENYDIPIKKFVGNTSRESGFVMTSLESDKIFTSFSWKKLGDEHVKGTEYRGMLEKNIASCFLIHIPININLYRSIYSSYVIGKCEPYVNEGKGILELCLKRYQQAEINILKNKQDKCNYVRNKINENNARASTNAGNFLIGIMNGMWEDLSC
jgi:hypothetical protein